MRSAFYHRARAAAVAAITVAGLALPLTAGATTAATPAAAATAPAATVRVPHYNHIVVIMFTDHDYVNILKNKHAPTFNRLAREYGLASRYYTTSDPDTAGIMAFLAGNSFGVNDGSPYWDQRLNKPSLLSQLDKAHKSWKEYVQDIPYAGYLGDCYPTVCQETDSLYKQEKFNPVPDLTSVADNPAEARKMVPASELATDARAGRLPNFSFIDANECINMHGGPPWCQDSPANLGEPNDNKLVAGGDAYLRQVTDEIMSGPQWRHGNNAIVITDTEGTTSTGCCDANPGTGHVFTVVITSHGPRHLKDSTPFNHYSLLATIQHAFGLGCLQFSCDTKHVQPMAKLFGAPSDGREAFSHTAGPTTIRRTPAAAAAAAGAAPALTPTPSPTVAPPAWQVVPSPNTGTSDNDLWSVAGRSPSDIWAVGSLLPNANATIVQTLALHYNGATWSRVKTPDVGKEANSLYGLAALPDGTAWATGIYTQASGHTGRALTEHWNGHRWSIVPAADPGASEDMLYSVAAASDTDVWAVGTYGDSAGFFHPLIEHWNGVHWSARPILGLSSGAAGILTSVTSSGAHGFWATGQLSGRGSDSQVVLHLEGGSWVVAHENAVRTPGGSPANAYPQAIAISAAGLWVAGRDRVGHSGYSTLVEAPGPGRSLRELKSPDPTTQDNYLWGIAPVGPGLNAWAVGDSVPVSTGNADSLIEYGSAAGGWMTVPSPDPGAPNGNTILDGVFAFGANNVWAVGTFDGKGGMKTLILHYTGGAL
jgi:Phosphoesterase family